VLGVVSLMISMRENNLVTLVGLAMQDYRPFSGGVATVVNRR